MYKIFCSLFLSLLSTTCFAVSVPPEQRPQAVQDFVCSGVRSVRTQPSTDTFSFSLAHRVFKSPGNVFISPYSANIALSMTMRGASGKTYDEMRKVLGKPSPIISGGGFTSYQAIAIDQAYNPLKSYVDEIQKDYQAGLLPVDFLRQPELAVVIINRWASKSTQGLIPELLKVSDIKPETKLAILNACHFKKAWLSPFDASLTHKAPFTTSEGRSSDVDMMSKLGYFKYGKDNKISYVELAFETNENEPEYSCLLILPEDQKSLVQLEKHLDANKLNQVDALLKKEHVQLYLPKLDIEYRIYMKEVLINLGMHEAFDEVHANFSKMTKANDLYIDKVIQQTHLKLNEAGLEAAAATAVLMVRKSSISPQPKVVVRFDRPFLILIREKETGTPLFIGRISKP
jgi:serpin B